MNLRSVIPLAILALLLAQLSCAVGTGLVPDRQSMPIARASLAPEHRVFYDALTDYGDWALIEPYGYVFRPRIAIDSWRPYGDGFWAPTDLYGWVWVSSEPFGWATYHYGRWFYDSFQGWVWMPGLEWGPAWVAWQASDDYVGWAPLTADDRYDRIPGGAFTYVRAPDLVSTDLRNRTMSQAEMGDEVSQTKPVENVVSREGVMINRGPSLDWVERRAGPIRRAQIDDLVGAAAAPAVTPSSGSTATPSDAETPPERIEEVQRAGEKAAGDARAMSQKNRALPGRLPVVRPFRAPSASPDRKPALDRRPGRPSTLPGKSRSAPPDSAR